MGSVQESSPSLPCPQYLNIANGISLLRPLSRRGHGPGVIILIHEDDTRKSHDPTVLHDGIPMPTLKWAEEGYVVAEIRQQAWQDSQDPLNMALDAISECDACDQKERVGLLAYSPELWNKVAPVLPTHPEIVGTIVYTDAASISSLADTSNPSIRHLAGSPSKDSPLPRTEALTGYSYASASNYSFATPLTHGYHYANEAVSHTRNLTFLKKLMNGPCFDLEAIWDEHTYYEFEERSVPKTMATMVQEPYVNHIPTMTGGIGREPLSDFYANHFVYQNPADTELELISRTVGIDRVVDEFLYKFTHSMLIDWLLPGIPPTHKWVEVPFTAVVNIRGDRLYHEHIAWDQATVLRQIGLLPEYLPLPGSVTVKGMEGRKLEYRVPAGGVQTAQKMRDKNCVESNRLFGFKVREVQ